MFRRDIFLPVRRKDDIEKTTLNQLCYNFDAISEEEKRLLVSVNSCQVKREIFFALKQKALYLFKIRNCVPSVFACKNEYQTL